MPKRYLVTYLQPTHNTSNRLALVHSQDTVEGLANEKPNETKERFQRQGSIIHDEKTVCRKILTWGRLIQAVCPKARALV